MNKQREAFYILIKLKGKDKNIREKIDKISILRNTWDSSFSILGVGLTKKVVRNKFENDIILNKNQLYMIAHTDNFGLIYNELNREIGDYLLLCNNENDVFDMNKLINDENSYFGSDINNLLKIRTLKNNINTPV